MSFTAKDVQALRQATRRRDDGCQARPRGQRRRRRGRGAVAAGEGPGQGGRAGRPGQHPGRRGAVFVDGNVGSIVQLKCETDFVASSERFKTLVSDMAALVAAKGDRGDGRARQGDRGPAPHPEGAHRARARSCGSRPMPATSLDSYLHVQGGRGINAVLVELAGGNAQLAHDIAVHVAFARPKYLQPGGRAGRRRREGAGHARGHHPQRGQAGAGHRARSSRAGSTGTSRRSACWSSPTPRTTSSRSASSSAGPRSCASPRSRSAESPGGQRLAGRSRRPRRPSGGGWC